MREQDMAAVLFAQGVQSGLNMEQVIDELGVINWPSFVDASAFRAALAEAAETQLRRQLDEQLAMIRRKIDGARPGATAPASTGPQVQAQRGNSSVVGQRSSAPSSPTFQPVDVHTASAAQDVHAQALAGAEPTTPPTPPTPEKLAAAPKPALVGKVQLDDAAEDELPSDATMVWTTQHGERSNLD